MKITKKEIRAARRCIEDAQYLVSYMEHHTFLKEADIDQLEELYRLLTKIGVILDGKRRFERSSKKARG